MPRLTKADLFDQVRTYLDTDASNFPNDLLDPMLHRVWFQAVSMEREWRFFQRRGTAEVTVDNELVPFTFVVDTVDTAGVRILNVRWGEQPMMWVEYTTGLDHLSGQGQPMAWSELNDGLVRNIRLFPGPSLGGTLTVDFYAEPVYPAADNLTFADVPAEFDAALVEGLLSDMYMREEDPDLAQAHRQMFLEQMGSIRNRWRISLDSPMVLAGQVRSLHRSRGFAVDGSYRDER